eukprot:scaffold90949_cov60-Phaeocystis_antarctica.AAC.6
MPPAFLPMRSRWARRILRKTRVKSGTALFSSSMVQKGGLLSQSVGKRPREPQGGVRARTRRGATGSMHEARLQWFVHARNAGSLLPRRREVCASSHLICRGEIQGRPESHMRAALNATESRLRARTTVR